MSESGSDNNSGASPEQAWRTIDKLNNALLTTVNRGDTVLFERGGTYYGQIRIPNLSTTAYLKISAYGTGARPVISSYKILNDVGGWVLHSAGIWKVNLTSVATHTGYTGTQADVGFLKVDGTIHGAKQSTLGSLSAAWDFYTDTTHLYVRADANPATLADDIRAASRGLASVDGAIIPAVNGLWVDDLELTGSGGNGIDGTAALVKVTNCKIHEIGGCYLSGTTRYGNGVQAWIGSRDWLVEGNEISECYDVALTAQGTVGADGSSWTNITFRENDIHDNSNSFEFFSGGTGGAGFVNVLVEDNTCTRGGYGWGAAVRPNPEVLVHFLTWGWALPADITVQGNVFDDAYAAYRFSSTPPIGVTFTGNVIRLKAGTKMLYQQADTIEAAAAWAAANSTEAGSTFEILP